MAENYPDFYIMKGGSYLYVNKKTLLLDDLNMTTSGTVSSGGLLVGPKYFNYGKCQELDTPTINVTSKFTPAVTLGNGTISDLKIYFDQVIYKESGYTTEACQYYDACVDGTADKNYYNFYEYVRNNRLTCSSEYTTNVKSDNDILCNAFTQIQTYNGCYDLNQEGVYNHLKECSELPNNDCSCKDANSMMCRAMYDAKDYCANNAHAAVEGYGTLHNVSISTKPDMDVANLIDNTGGTLTLSGNNNLIASTSSLKRGGGVNARDVVIADGTTKVHSGRGFVIYNYDTTAKLTIKQGATLEIEYADFNGLTMTWGGTADIFGKLKVSSWGSGGKFNNDIATNKGIVNAKSTSCLILPNGASGTGGYTGTVNSGTLNFASGSQLKLMGSCKRAATSGSAVIKDKEKPDNLYGDFTSHPSEFTGSCDSSCN